MPQTTRPFDFEVFYDGECPLCVREIKMIRRMDQQGRIGFIDISLTSFDAASVGVSWSSLMARIHGRLPDGTLVEGVEVFRLLYTAVGLGWLVSITRVPGVSHILEICYRVFAENRLRLTGRCTDGVCRMPPVAPHETPEPEALPAAAAGAGA